MSNSVNNNQKISEHLQTPRFLKAFLWIVDIQMILYWSLALFRLLAPGNLSEENLYGDYYDPIMIAWNWSFFPLDMILSFTGLGSLYLLRNGNPNWRIMATFSLALTFCAGLMAISFWAIRLEFYLMWWGFNFAYMAGALWFLPKLSLRFAAKNLVND